MVPYSQRRHRLNPDEIEPVRDAALYRLLQLVKTRGPGTLDEAGSLFRIWYRITYYIRNKPSYPKHGTYELISAQLPYGTVLPPREGTTKPAGAEEQGEEVEP